MMKTTLIRTLLLSGLVSLVAAAPASADILFVFAPTASGGVKVTGTGSGFADRDPSIASSDWDVQDFQTNFLQVAFGTDQTSSDTISGSFTNVTTGISENFLNFDVDADGGISSDNDLDYDTTQFNGGDLTFNLGDEYLLQLSATFLPTTLAFTDLVQGNHIDVGHTTGSGIAEESFGITTVKVLVPEPATLGLLLGCFTSWGILGRRKH